MWLFFYDVISAFAERWIIPMNARNVILSLHKHRNMVMDFCKKFKKIYIYGIGSVAEITYRYLLEEGITVTGAIISDGEEKKNFHRLPVKVFSETSVDSDDGIIIAMHRRFQEAVLEKFRERNILRNCIAPRFVGNERNECTKYCLPTRKSGKYFKEYHNLNSSGEKLGTDKCSKYHDYLRKYEFFLSKYKDEKFVFLELGIYQGSSLRMWSEYFKNADIIGVDINEECRKFEREKISCKIMDLSSWENLINLSMYKPSIIVDDASHLWSHQIKALFALFPALPSGGIYILEDITTSFSICEGMIYQDAPYSTYDVLHTISRVVTSGEYLTASSYSCNTMLIFDDIEELAMSIDMISFIHGSCIIIKK